VGTVAERKLGVVGQLSPKHGAAQAEEFGRRVRDRRLALGRKLGEMISQERLGEFAGLHRTYIGHVERGEVNVALYNVIKIAAALDTDPANLVRGLKP
jgi:transcriptional regulator with XRE-family HTH domain